MEEEVFAVNKLVSVVEARDVELFKAELKKSLEQQENYLELPIELIKQEIINNSVFDNPRRWYRNHELKEMLELCGYYIKKKLISEIKQRKKIFSASLLNMLNALPLEQIEDVLSSSTKGGIALLYYFRRKIVKNGLENYINIALAVENINNKLMKLLAEKPDDKIWKAVLMQDGMVVPLVVASDNKVNSQRISTMQDDKAKKGKATAAVDASTPLLQDTTTVDSEAHDFGRVSEGEFPELQLVEFESDPQEQVRIAALSFNEVLDNIRDKFFSGKKPYKDALRARLQNPPVKPDALYAVEQISFAHERQSIDFPPGLAEINLLAVLDVLNRYWCFDKGEIRKVLSAKFRFKDVSFLCYLRHKNIDLSQYGRVNDVVKEINRKLFNGVVALLNEDHGHGAPQGPEKIKDKINEALKAGMDPNTQDDNGWTLAHHVIQGFINNKTDADIFMPIEALRIQGANFNIKNKDGDTALHFAVFYRKASREFVKALVTQCHAIPELANNLGNTAAGQVNAVVLVDADSEPEPVKDAPTYLRKHISALHAAIELRDVHKARTYFTSDTESPATMATRTRGGNLSSFAFIDFLKAPYAKAIRFVRWYHTSELQEIRDLNLAYFRTIFLPRNINGDNDLSESVVQNLPGLLSILNELSESEISSVLTRRSEHGAPACALYYIRKHAGAILANYERVNKIAEEIHQQHAHVSTEISIYDYNNFVQALNNGVDFHNIDFLQSLDRFDNSQVKAKIAELHGHPQVAYVAEPTSGGKSRETVLLESVTGEGADARDKAKYLKKLSSYCSTNNIEKLGQLLEKVRQEGDAVKQNGGAEAVTAFINTKHNGWTALHCAVAAGASDVVNLLLKKGASVNAMTDTGFAPIHYLLKQTGSVFEGNKKVHEIFVDHYEEIFSALASSENIDLNIKDLFQQKTFLDYLVEIGLPLKAKITRQLRATFIRNVLDTGRVWVTQRNMDQASTARDEEASKALNGPISLLMEAIVQVDPAVEVAAVKKLIATGMNINLMDIHNKSFPIHAAILRGNLEVIDLLLAEGADLYSKEKPKRSKSKADDKGKDEAGAKDKSEKEGMTALYSVVLYHKQAVLKHLVAKHKGIFGDDAKEALCGQVYKEKSIEGEGFVEFIHQLTLLISSGLGAYLLIEMIRNKDYKLLERVIDLGANVNDKTDAGVTALGAALAYGFDEGLMLLLERGAKPTEEQEPKIVALLKTLATKSAEASSVDEEEEGEDEDSVSDSDVLPPLEEDIRVVADPATVDAEQNNNDQEFDDAARKLEEDDAKTNSGESVESSTGEEDSTEENTTEEEEFFSMRRPETVAVAAAVAHEEEDVTTAELMMAGWVKNYHVVPANGILEHGSPVTAKFNSDPLSRKLVEDAELQNGHGTRPRTATK